jgi:hypothetical protein
MLVRRPGIDVIHLGVRGMLVLNKAIAKRNGDQIVFFMEKWNAQIHGSVLMSIWCNLCSLVVSWAMPFRAVHLDKPITSQQLAQSLDCSYLGTRLPRIIMMRQGREGFSSTSPQNQRDPPLGPVWPPARFWAGPWCLRVRLALFHLMAR